MRILFHGTSKDRQIFSEDSIGLGSDPNSALGVHATHDPLYALNYAEISHILDDNSIKPIVFVLSYEEAGVDSIYDYDDFYGSYEDDTNTKDHFSDKRSIFMENGIDLVEFEGGEEPISTLLDPKKIKIIYKLDKIEVEELSKILISKKIDWHQNDLILDALKKLKEKIT